MRNVRIVGLLAVLASVSLLGIGGANAQGTPEARQACTPDAMRLCSEFIPDVAKITACMRAKRSQLSEACRVAMGGGHRKVREASSGHRHEKHVTHHHYYHHHHYHHHSHSQDH